MRIENLSLVLAWDGRDGSTEPGLRLEFRRADERGVSSHPEGLIAGEFSLATPSATWASRFLCFGHDLQEFASQLERLDRTLEGRAVFANSKGTLSLTIASAIPSRGRLAVGGAVEGGRTGAAQGSSPRINVMPWRSALDGMSGSVYSMRIFRGDSAMTIARGQLIDVSVTRWYHCMSRCVRGALLLCEGPSDRKEWIENRIEELAQIFALSVGGFSVKARISADLPGILDRIGSSAKRWQLRMEKLRDGRSFGRFFAASRDKLREIAQRLNVRRLVKLVGCAAP